MKIWIVTRANEYGKKPTLPVPYPTEEAANAHVEEAMREEWELYGAEDDDTGERLPYLGDWRAAQDRILKGFTDGSWTPFEITAHDVDFGPVVEAAGDMLATLINLLKPGSVCGSVIEDGRDLLARIGHGVREVSAND